MSAIEIHLNGLAGLGVGLLARRIAGRNEAGAKRSYDIELKTGYLVSVWIVRSAIRRANYYTPDRRA